MQSSRDPFLKQKISRDSKLLTAISPCISLYLYFSLSVSVEFSMWYWPVMGSVAGWLVTSDSVWRRWLNRAVWKAARGTVCSSSASMPSSMDVSITLLGSEPLTLRTTTGGSGSSKQPSTWHTNKHKSLAKLFPAQTAQHSPVSRSDKEIKTKSQSM